MYFAVQCGLSLLAGVLVGFFHAYHVVSEHVLELPWQHILLSIGKAGYRGKRHRDGPDPAVAAQQAGDDVLVAEGSLERCGGGCSANDEGHTASRPAAAGVDALGDDLVVLDELRLALAQREVGGLSAGADGQVAGGGGRAFDLDGVDPAQADLHSVIGRGSLRVGELEGLRCARRRRRGGGGGCRGGRGCRSCRGLGGNVLKACGHIANGEGHASARAAAAGADVLGEYFVVVDKLRLELAQRYVGRLGNGVDGEVAGVTVHIVGAGGDAAQPDLDAAEVHGVLWVGQLESLRSGVRRSSAVGDGRRGGGGQAGWGGGPGGGGQVANDERERGGRVGAGGAHVLGEEFVVVDELRLEQVERQAGELCVGAGGQVAEVVGRLVGCVRFPVVPKLCDVAQPDLDALEARGLARVGEIEGLLLAGERGGGGSRDHRHVLELGPLVVAGAEEVLADPADGGVESRKRHRLPVVGRVIGIFRKPDRLLAVNAHRCGSQGLAVCRDRHHAIAATVAGAVVLGDADRRASGLRQVGFELRSLLVEARREERLLRTDLLDGFPGARGDADL